MQSIVKVASQIHLRALGAVGNARCAEVGDAEDNICRGDAHGGSQSQDGGRELHFGGGLERSGTVWWLGKVLIVER